jgi:hypothetical protein
MAAVIPERHIFRVVNMMQSNTYGPKVSVIQRFDGIRCAPIPVEVNNRGHVIFYDKSF